MGKYRLRFSKSGRAVWMSHLDLMRTMQRALLRAGVSLEYSSGFNPHIVMSIALPLSVGMSSECELMDFGVIGEPDARELERVIGAALPEGIEALEIYAPTEKFGAIKYLRFDGFLEYDEDVTRELAELFAESEIVIDKKSKRGVNRTDIAPFIVKNTLELGRAEGGVTLRADIMVPELSPAHLLEAIRQLRPEIAPESASFTRRALLKEDFSIFR